MRQIKPGKSAFGRTTYLLSIKCIWAQPMFRQTFGAPPLYVVVCKHKLHGIHVIAVGVKLELGTISEACHKMSNRHLKKGNLNDSKDLLPT